MPVFFAVLLVLLFVHNSHISLWDQDEGAYAGFAHRMMKTGDWLVPEFPWSFIHRKTPLHFWNIALSYLLFGENNFAVRFSSALSIWLLFVAVYRYGRSLFGEVEARLSMLVLATSLFVISLAKVAVTDATLLLFSTLAAFAVLQHFKQKSWLNTVLFWVWIALALMVKGPPILIFLGFFAVLLLVFHPERKKLFGLHPWFFLPLALVPLYLWGSAAWQKDDGVFITWLIDWYVLKRVGGSVLGQSAPFGTHFLFLIVVFLPYLVFQPKMWLESFKEAWRKNSDYMVLVLWFIAAWLPYEFSPSKLPAYTVAAHVPIALLLAKTMKKRGFLLSKGALFYTQIGLQGLIILAIPVAVFYLDLANLFKISSLISSVVLFALLIFSLKGSVALFSKLLLFNSAFTIVIWTVIYGQIDSIKNSPEAVGEYLSQHDFNRAIIANHKGHPPSLLVYAERALPEVLINSDINELDSMVQSADSKTLFILTDEQWIVLSEHESLKLDTTVCSNFTDRKGKSCYYLASKP